MNHDEQFDKILDEALNEYRDAEPLAGLEDRVLRRLPQAGGLRRIPWLRWAIATTCAAVVALAIWFGFARRPIETHTPNTLATAKPAQQAPAQVPAPVVSAPAVTARRASKVVLAPTASAPGAEAHAKPPVFPLPTPLNGNERVLMSVLQQGPKVMPGASGDSNPITIAEIEIKPLTIGDISSSESPGEKQ